MRFEEMAIKPGEGTAPRWLRRIFELKISDDLGFSRVRGPEAPAAMDQATGLVEIFRPRDIRRNDAIMVPSFVNTVDLDGQQDRDSAPIQFTGKLVDGRPTPAVTEKNDTGILLLFCRESTVSICV
ncbi:MAG TPA: hypothetical protein VMU48_12755 [Terracidiphilus sp.]|nr:hypothetical protein [Terracidiphilus sp.]